MIDIELDIDYDELRVGTIFEALTSAEKAIMLGKLLGSLSNTAVLDNREAGMFFCNIAREATVSSIARDFKCSESLAYNILSKATKKIRLARETAPNDNIH